MVISIGQNFEYFNLTVFFLGPNPTSIKLRPTGVQCHKLEKFSSRKIFLNKTTDSGTERFFDPLRDPVPAVFLALVRTSTGGTSTDLVPVRSSTY